MNRAIGFALCLCNDGYAASLEVRKAYSFLEVSDREKEKGLLRIVDESGEDYLFPSSLFLVLELPSEAEAELRKTAR